MKHAQRLSPWLISLALVSAQMLATNAQAATEVSKPKAGAGKIQDLSVRHAAVHALWQVLHAFEAGNLEAIKPTLDVAMVGRQRFIDHLQDEMDHMRGLRIQLIDTEVVPGQDVTVIHTRWEKRYYVVGPDQSLDPSKPVLETGQSSFLMHKMKDGSWQLASLAGDALFNGRSFQADYTPDPFSFPPQANVPPGNTVESAAITLSGVNVPVKISASAGVLSINGGPFMPGQQTAKAGDSIKVQLKAPAQLGQQAQSLISIGDASATFVVSTVNVDNVPDPVSFAPVMGATMGTLATSSPARITGINTPITASVLSGNALLAVNGGPFQTQVTLNNQDSLTVQMAVPDTPSTTATATIALGNGMSTQFMVSSEAFDAVPDPFAFMEQTGVALGSWINSNTVQVQGLAGNIPVTVNSGTGARLSIQNGPWVSSGNIRNGQSLAVQVLSPNVPGSSSVAMVQIGTGTPVPFKVTTINADAFPDAFRFNNQFGVPVNTMTVSNTVAINGINTSVPVTVTGDGNPSISIDGGPWAAAGQIQNGQNLSVRLTSATTALTTSVAQVQVGTASPVPFSITTVNAVDIVPDPFSFTPPSVRMPAAPPPPPALIAGPPASTAISNRVTILGINSPSPIATSNGWYSINGGAWKNTMGTINNGDIVAVQVAVPAVAGNQNTVTLTIGGVSATFTVTAF